MKESYSKGVANHIGPESCLDSLWYEAGHKKIDLTYITLVSATLVARRLALEVSERKYSRDESRCHSNFEKEVGEICK